MKVSKGQAEIGITSLDVTAALEGSAPRLGLQVLGEGALVPVTFAAARDLDFGQPLREEVIKVLRWVVSNRIKRQIRELSDQLSDRNLQYDASARAYPKGALEFLPGEQLANEWSARYEHKSSQRRLY